jgi:hypothetical protein
MASHSQYNPHTESNPKMSNSLKKEEVEQLFPEITHALPHEELNQFIRIARAYAQKIRSLPLAPLLPHRKKVSRLVVDTPDQVFVHTVEYLIDFSLTEIKQPLNLILETPVGNYSEFDNFKFDKEGYNLDQLALELDDMEDNNDNDE